MARSAAADIDRLKADLADSPDVTPDERMRIVAHAWVVRAAFLVAALLAFPLAFFIAGWLMMWIDGGRGTAALCGLMGAFGSAALPATVRATGLAIERRYLRRVLRRSTVREQARLASAASTSPFAISSSIEPR